MFQRSIGNLKTCLGTKEVFTVNKTEYIEHIRKCSKGPRGILNKCLPDELRYVPDFILELLESVVRLFYDDFIEIKRK